MVISEIVKKYLIENGFDGLCSGDDNECGCGIDDFMPCGSCCCNCLPAYQYKLTDSNCNDCEDRCFLKGMGSFDYVFYPEDMPVKCRAKIEREEN